MALTAWSIINVSSYVPLQIFFKWGCLRLRFLFFLPLPTFWLLFFFSVFFSCISFFYQLAEAQPNSTQLDSIRLQTQTPAFILASSWTGGPGRQAALLPLPFAAIVISLITKWGVDLQGECGAVRCSGVESSRMEWSGVLERWGLQLGTGKWAAVWNIFHLARWLGCCLCDGASVFAPQSPHFLPPLPKPNWQWKTTSFIISLFFLSSFFWLFGLVGWLVGCLAGWLAENIFCCRFCFSAFLFYFRSLKVNLERSRKWHCRRFQSANWSYLRGSSFTHRLKWNWKWKGAKRGSI